MHLCNRSTKKNKMIYSWGVNLDGHSRSSALLKAAAMDATNKQKNITKEIQQQCNKHSISGCGGIWDGRADNKVSKVGGKSKAV